MVSLYFCAANLIHDFSTSRDPTPSTSGLTKWYPTSQYPLDYYRIGNLHQEHEPIVKMDRGLFDERARFWRTVGAHLPASHLFKEEL